MKVDNASSKKVCIETAIPHCTSYVNANLSQCNGCTAPLQTNDDKSACQCSVSGQKMVLSDSGAPKCVAADVSLIDGCK